MSLIQWVACWCFTPGQPVLSPQGDSSIQERWLAKHKIFSPTSPLRTLVPLGPSTSYSSDGNSSLLDEGGSTSQVPQATVELAGYGSGVWPDSLSEWRGQDCSRCCCLTTSLTVPWDWNIGGNDAVSPCLKTADLTPPLPLPLVTLPLLLPLTRLPDCSVRVDVMGFASSCNGSNETLVYFALVFASSLFMVDFVVAVFICICDSAVYILASHVAS